MDPQPPAMMSGSYVNVNAHAPPYSLAEIWQLPMNGGGETGQGMPQFGNNRSMNQDGPCDDPMHPGDGGSRGGGGGGGTSVWKRREVEEEPAKGVSTSNGSSHGNGNGMNDCDGKRIKTSAYRKDNGTNNTGEAEPRPSKPMEESKPPPEPPKQDYIHVRARRGQATDSHSLAERARREKISERMKILQDLVPGCNKVIGKALVLDEIINYIQSLQHQVEFLSMKLEALNSRINPGIDVFPPKEFGQPMFDNAGVAFNSQAPREYSRGSSPEWLHMNIGGSFERTT